MQYNECLNLIFNANRRQTATSVKDRPSEEQSPEFVDALLEDKYSRTLKNVNALKIKYMPETKPIIPPLVMKMEPLVPIDCFLNISLTRRGFRKCKFDGKPFAKITQPLHRRVSFVVFEGLWKIKDSRLERDSRPKVPRDILEKAAKFFQLPLDHFNGRLLTRLLRQYEEERRIASANLLNRFGPCPIWRVSLREILEGLERTLKMKNENSSRRDGFVLEVACALTMGRFNVSNWHAPDVPKQRKSKPSWQNPSTHLESKNKTQWHQVKEYVLFTADNSWHVYCIK
ncbi:hypothetical protein GE061_006034 [Apolygus lucorum]|uniref:Uncharacterized protein n=1 Tax=Apolygus lucorum TaxID=248454 RepID=A0A8S9WV76_APOLU|nr:hypothetical protein GE061_006034 [Apolygus lucorum]